MDELFAALIQALAEDPMILVGAVFVCLFFAALLAVCAAIAGSRAKDEFVARSAEEDA